MCVTARHRVRKYVVDVVKDVLGEAGDGDVLILGQDALLLRVDNSVQIEDQVVDRNSRDLPLLRLASASFVVMNKNFPSI